jgi:acyl-CoA hydrolase
MIAGWILFVSSAFADENRSSVDIKIAQMEKALKEDRERLVAQLKAMIVEINAKERRDAVGKYQQKTHQENNSTIGTFAQECSTSDR